MASIYDFVVEAIDGSPVALADYRGKPLLIVNVASKCGLTESQYAELSALSRQFADKLEVFAFPCNQFLEQEPGTAEEICEFVLSVGGENFKIFAKVEVNGDNANPLFVFLRGVSELQGAPIQWNFGKFLVSPDGAVKHYGPRVLPSSFAAEIESYVN
mmetsp:Transcript_9628/g.18768  ORF Transcript_9628/g.18768 Transcript_9628/m.18768 type:complete len:158 (+) Transcript_9628:2304-2777(+)